MAIGWKHFATSATLKRALAVAVWVTACGASEERHVQTNKGSLCFRQDLENLEVLVVRDGCLSSSCDTDREASCSVDLVDGTITVVSRFAYTSPTGTTSCTADCGILEARCGTVAPADGQYEVVFGPASAEVELPLDEPTPVGGVPDGFQCSRFD